MVRKVAIKLTTGSFITKQSQSYHSNSTTNNANITPLGSSKVNKDAVAATESDLNGVALGKYPTPPYDNPKDTNALASQLGKRKAANRSPPPSGRDIRGGDVKAPGTRNMAEPPAKRSRRTDIVSNANDRGNKVEVKKEDRDGERERVDRDRRDERDARDNRRRERSRTRSPVRGGRRGARRGRSRSPPGRNGRDVKDQGGSRNRSPPRGPRGRGGSPPRKPSGKTVAFQQQIPVKVEKMDIDSPALDDVDAQTELMQRIMGFSLFRTTKNTKVPGNDKLYGVRKDKEIKARQYMNRTGGFNRPLSPG